MKGSALTVGLVVVVLVGFVGGYYVGTDEVQTITTTSTETTTSYSSVQIQSIRLENQTVGSALILNVTFKNTGDISVFYCMNCVEVFWSILPSNATQREAVVCYPIEIPSTFVPLDPGATANAYSAPCYKYCNTASCQFVADKFIASGTVIIDVALRWYSSADWNSATNSTAFQSFDISG